MKREVRKHADVEQWLATDVCANVFPLYVCRMRPEGLCVVTTSGRSITGCLVAGARWGLAPAGRAWLVSTDAVAAELLIDAAEEEALVDGQLGVDRAGTGAGVRAVQ